MKVIASLLLLSSAATLMCHGAQWYVSANGSGDGSTAYPWRLQVALTNSAVHAGDTVWLRGGTYVPTATNTHSEGAVQWLVTLQGTTTDPITFRPYTNETAKLDRQWYFINPASFASGTWNSTIQ